jgi:hypothetical protein
MAGPTESARAAFLAITPPRITIDVPPAEQEHARSVSILLDLIQSFENDFAKALELFDHLVAQERPFPLSQFPHKWALIPARDAVMTVHNVGDALEALNRAVDNCSTIRNSLNDNSLKPIIGFFKAAFPHATDMRNSRAHPVQRLSTHSQREVHGLVVLPGRVVIHCELRDRTITYVHNKRRRSLEISQTSLNVIQRTKLKLFDLFRRFDQTDYSALPHQG